jgi:hypothetical protein
MISTFTYVYFSDILKKITFMFMFVFVFIVMKIDIDMDDLGLG